MKTPLTAQQIKDIFSKNYNQRVADLKADKVFENIVDEVERKEREIKETDKK
jgi:hypothetical protein